MNNEKGPKLAAVAQCQDKKSSLFQKYDFAKWILYDVWRLDKRVRLCCVPSRALLPSYVHSCTRATSSIRKFVNTLLPSHARLCMCYFFHTYVRARATSFALAFVHVLFFRAFLHALLSSYTSMFACAFVCLGRISRSFVSVRRGAVLKLF